MTSGLNKDRAVSFKNLSDSSDYEYRVYDEELTSTLGRAPFKIYKLYFEGSPRNTIRVNFNTGDFFFTDYLTIAPGFDGGGTSSSELTIGGFLSKNNAFPRFRLDPKTLLRVIYEPIAKLTDKSMRRIAFEEDSDFFSKYWLVGNDETRLRSLFSTGVRKILMRDPQWHIRGAGNLIVLYFKDARVSNKHLAQNLQDLLLLVKELVGKSS